MQLLVIQKCGEVLAEGGWIPLVAVLLIAVMALSPKEKRIVHHKNSDH